MKKTKCPFCGNEYKNVSVHLRFCAEKKKTEEKNIISEEQINLVEEALDKNFSTIEKEPVKELVEEKPEELIEEELEEISDILESATVKTLKIKKTPEIEEIEKTQEPIEPIDSTKIVESKDIGIESTLKIEKIDEGIHIRQFNEDKDNWVSALMDLFNSLEIDTKVILELEGKISHEFDSVAGIYRYPGDMFFGILREHTDKWSDGMNVEGKQTITFIKTK